MFVLAGNTVMFMLNLSDDVCSLLKSEEIKVNLEYVFVVQSQLLLRNGNIGEI